LQQLACFLDLIAFGLFARMGTVTVPLFTMDRDLYARTFALGDRAAHGHEQRFDIRSKTTDGEVGRAKMACSVLRCLEFIGSMLAFYGSTHKRA